MSLLHTEGGRNETIEAIETRVRISNASLVDTIGTSTNETIIDCCASIWLTFYWCRNVVTDTYCHFKKSTEDFKIVVGKLRGKCRSGRKGSVPMAINLSCGKDKCFAVDIYRKLRFLWKHKAHPITRTSLALCWLVSLHSDMWRTPLWVQMFVTFLAATAELQEYPSV